MSKLCRLLGLLLTATTLILAQPRADESEFFEKEIRPLLATQCFGCHSSKANPRFAGLSLDSREGVNKGSDSGPVIVPGDPDHSKLIRAVRGQTPVRMPPSGPLKAEQIAALARWISMGAPYPGETAQAASQLEFNLDQRRQEHWAWKPIQRTIPPAVHDETWVLQPSDRFVLAALERQGMKPARPADRRSLLRRLSFDLTGLPPSPEELAAFEADHSPNAYEKQVDRLLASPRFGEHWARHWMDLVRYSESHGSEGDPDTPGAWRYRDYLIRAFNSDVPYNDFIREQLAGDLLRNPRLNAIDRTNESMLGVAHLAMVEYGFQPLDPLEDRLKWTDNQVDVFAKTFQGLTVSCARCHDHKFDAISQKDYYGLYGIFSSARITESAIDLPEVANGNVAALVSQKKQIRKELAASWIDAARQLPGMLGRTTFLAAHQDDLSNTDSALQPWLALREKSVEAFPAAWKELADHWKAEIAARREFDSKNFQSAWDLRGSDYDQWFKRGSGVPQKPVKSGEFAILPNGDKIVSGIYPAGVYSHLLSQRQNGVIQSPRFKMDTDSVSVRVLGGSYATAQLIIENHGVSRGGHFFRIPMESDEMGWVRWDTAFWKGLTGYIEVATTEDVTYFNTFPRPKKKATGTKNETEDMPKAAEKPSERPVKPKDGRSWFGIDKVYFHNNTLTPKDDVVGLCYLLEGETPKTPAELARHYSDQLVKAIEAWENDSLSDNQAAFLDYFVRQGILPNSLKASEKLQAPVASYRAEEEKVPLLKRAPSVIEEAGGDQPLFIRGNHMNPGQPVPWHFLDALGGTVYADHATARLSLAETLVSPQDPLTSRVLVNRVWKYLFGSGIVRTVDNFGKLGEPPTHPELLDWLATRFVDDGWSTKKLIRLLATSQTYQMDSVPSNDAAQNDPTNKWLQHMPVKRLEAEAIRDSALFVSGGLDLTMFGPSIPTWYARDSGKTSGDTPKGPLDGGGRRSVYLEVRRNISNPFLEVFDQPKPSSTRGQRDITSVPAQSLALLNDPLIIDQANRWAKAVLAKDQTPSARIEDMFVRALGRPPFPEERDAAQTLLEQMRKEHAPAGADADFAAWSDLAHSIMNLKEFIYIR
ncbi:MAG: PSD1 and planctomycete cytochrome C domain-containing protein [Acidobacteriia bacterium]|nr:PSD1 and planctomycete cytochrome C domain-containing protein [Terriglobia bacterium]